MTASLREGMSQRVFWITRRLAQGAFASCHSATR